MCPKSDTKNRIRIKAQTMSEENLPKDVTYLTREGMRKLETELAHLRTDGRAEVAQRLHQALEEGGDLLENAEFEAAKNEQAFVEGRIMTLVNKSLGVLCDNMCRK